MEPAKPVGDDHHAVRQAGCDNRGHQLRPGRRKEQQLGIAGNGAGVNQVIPQVLAQLRGTRVAQQGGTVAPGYQGVVQTARLVGFSGALAALESYEYPGHIVAPNGGEFGGEG